MNSVTAVRPQDPTPTAAVVGSAAAVVDPPRDSDQVFGPGLGILQLYSRMLTQLAKDHQDQMKIHGEIANEAQKMVSAMDALIAEIDMKEKPGGVVPWSAELSEYANAHPELNVSGVLVSASDKAGYTELRGKIEKYAKQHQGNGNLVTQANKMLYAVEVLIAKIDKPGGVVPWSAELSKYANAYPELNFSEGLVSASDKAGCTALRGKIQKYATQHSDASSQVQLQVQKTMQTYNVTVGLMNSLQTMLAEMTKQFAQAIR